MSCNMSENAKKVKICCGQDYDKKKVRNMALSLDGKNRNTIAIKRREFRHQNLEMIEKSVIDGKTLKIEDLRILLKKTIWILENEKNGFNIEIHRNSYIVNGEDREKLVWIRKYLDISRDKIVIMKGYEKHNIKTTEYVYMLFLKLCYPKNIFLVSLCKNSVKKEEQCDGCRLYGLQGCFMIWDSVYKQPFYVMVEKNIICVFEDNLGKIGFWKDRKNCYKLSENKGSYYQYKKNKQTVAAKINRIMRKMKLKGFVVLGDCTDNLHEISYLGPPTKFVERIPIKIFESKNKSILSYTQDSEKKNSHNEKTEYFGTYIKRNIMRLLKDVF